MLRVHLVDSMTSNTQHSEKPNFWSRARSILHDQITTDTSARYLSLLHQVPENSYVLDLDIGTASGLAAHINLLKAKSITIVGLQPDIDYFQKALEVISVAGITDRVKLVQSDIFNLEPPSNRLFNFVFCLKITHDDQAVKTLERCADLLVDREDGRVLVVDTFELQKNNHLEWWRPTLTSITSIRVDGVLYEADFEDMVSEAGLHIEKVTVVQDNINIEGVREARLLSLRSRIYITSEPETIE